jgi:hypothetical protein
LRHEAPQQRGVRVKAYEVRCELSGKLAKLDEEFFQRLLKGEGEHQPKKHKRSYKKDSVLRRSSLEEIKLIEQGRRANIIFLD